jgi:hypothetical protein
MVIHIIFSANSPFCRTQAASPDISCSAQNASILERRLAVGFAFAMTLKAD